MSTPNFKNINASKVYAIEIEEDYEYGDLVANLSSELKLSPCDVTDNDRNYIGTIIGEIHKQVGKWKLYFQVIARSGYYSGLNLDWNCVVIDSVTDTEFDFNDTDLPQTVKNKIESLKKKVEKVFAQKTTPLIRVATFSNGEAVYRKA